MQALFPCPSKKHPELILDERLSFTEHIDSEINKLANFQKLSASCLSVFPGMYTNDLQVF